MEYDTASRSLVPIQPKSEAAESWDPVMCAQCPICNSGGLHSRSLLQQYIYQSISYI